MSGFESFRPSYDEWMYWAQVIVDRLTTVTEIYGHPPFPEVFMPEKERQDKLAQAVAAMRDLHERSDSYELNVSADPAQAPAREASLIEMLQPIFRGILELLPMWSQDMQKLLKSPWANECADKTARILFRGPPGQEKEGIGSGMVENGRLPAQLYDMLDREAAGGERSSRLPKPKLAPDRMRREDIARNWAKQNAAFLRSAGRIN